MTFNEFSMEAEQKNWSVSDPCMLIPPKARWHLEPMISGFQTDVVKCRLEFDQEEEKTWLDINFFCVSISTVWPAQKRPGTPFEGKKWILQWLIWVVDVWSKEILISLEVWSKNRGLLCSAIFYSNWFKIPIYCNTETRVKKMCLA